MGADLNHCTKQRENLEREGGWERGTRTKAGCTRRRNLPHNTQHSVKSTNDIHFWCQWVLGRNLGSAPGDLEVYMLGKALDLLRLQNWGLKQWEE